MWGGGAYSLCLSLSKKTHEKSGGGEDKGAEHTFFSRFFFFFSLFILWTKFTNMHFITFIHHFGLGGLGSQLQQSVALLR